MAEALESVWAVGEAVAVLMVLMVAMSLVMVVATEQVKLLPDPQRQSLELISAIVPLVSRRPVLLVFLALPLSVWVALLFGRGV